MKTTKKNKDFAELITALTELSDKDFKSAIKVAKQYRKADKSLAKAIERQQQEFVMPKKSSNNRTTAGLDYEYA